MTKHATTGTYIFRREMAQSVGASRKQIECTHTHISLLNDPGPVIECATCTQRWLLQTLPYGPPLVVALERCGMCGEPVDLPSPVCSLHELRAAAAECITLGDDNRIGRAALRYTSTVLKHIPAHGKMSEMLARAIEMLEKMYSGN